MNRFALKSGVIKHSTIFFAFAARHSKRQWLNGSRFVATEQQINDDLCTLNAC